MTHHDNDRASEAEDTTHFTIEDASCLCASLTLYINTLIVEANVVQSLYIILTEMADDAVATRDRHGQSASVALKVTTDAPVVAAHGIEHLIRFFLSFCHLLFMSFGICGSLTLGSNTSL